jgi:hypothetical protein
MRLDHWLRFDRNHLKEFARWTLFSMKQNGRKPSVSGG